MADLYLFHLVPWGVRDQLTQPDSLESEGFVHLCSASQLVATARRWYSDQQELGVLVFAIADLQHALRWEDLYQRGRSFPHLYGPLPLERLQAVIRMPRLDGEFVWPRGLSGFASPLSDGAVEGTAVIEPGQRFPDAILPQNCVLCFFEEVLASLPSSWERPGSAVGPEHVYRVGSGASEVVACYPGVGAPKAAAVMEELVALGCRNFVLCGGAGALQAQPLGSLVLVSEAVRDEGTSSHYLAPTPLVSTCSQALAACQQRLENLSISFQVGRSWTTDALYRETSERVQRRQQQACLTVEMEVAALLAVAQFRGVNLVPLLYCGDSLDADEWDFREWTEATTTRERLFYLACDLATRLPHTES